MGCSPPGSFVYELLQARILEWGAIPFSRRCSRPRDWTGVSLHCSQILYHLRHHDPRQEGWTLLWWCHTVTKTSVSWLLAKSCFTLQPVLLWQQGRFYFCILNMKVEFGIWGSSGSSIQMSPSYVSGCHYVPIRDTSKLCLWSVWQPATLQWDSGLHFQIASHKPTEGESFLLVTQSCPTFCDPKHCSPPGSSVHGIPQARTLEGIFPSPGDLLNPGIKPRSPALQADSLSSEPPGKL